MGNKTNQIIKFLIGILVVVFISTSITACGNNTKANANENSKVESQEDSNVKNITESEEKVKPEKEDNTVPVITEDTEKDEEGTNVESSEAKVHFINTGNSDAILIVQGDKAVLVDAGDNDDEGLVTSYIKNLGVTAITYLISTHPDADHSGGLDAVINNFDIGQFFVGNGSADTKTYTDVINAAANKGVNPSVPLEDSIFNITENSYIQFFNTSGGSDSNESSLVTLFVNGEDKFLLTGDAGSETENEITSKMPDVDVLKVGHHGSKGSTTESFISKVAPEYAVILTGKNSYGHPTSEVLNRIESKGIKLHRSDECGNIIFNSTGNGVSTECGLVSFTAGATAGSAQSSNNSLGSTSGDATVNNNSESTSEETPTGEMVWLSATGEKYHSINNCGRMNPDKARQVTLEQAQNQGMTACSKCN